MMYKFYIVQTYVCLHIYADDRPTDDTKEKKQVEIFLFMSDLEIQILI